MILHAIRLRDVRGFGPEGVELALQPGLNVLSEVNEFGKSTVFDAVRTAFFNKHTATNADVRSLTPWAGGVPHIEIDMDLGEQFGGPVRLSRKFHKSAGLTRLRALSTGRELAVADAAHEQLQAVLGATKAGGGPTGLLWVEQGHATGEIETGPANTALLTDLLSREIGSLTGGDRARAYLEAAQSQLKALITPGRGNPAGEYKATIAAVEALDAELLDLEARRDRTETARRELERVTRELAELKKRGAGDGAAKLDAARTRLRQAETAQNRLQIAQLERDAAQTARDTATARQNARREDAQTLAEQDTQHTAHTEIVAKLEATAATLKTQLDTATTAEAQAKGRAQTARQARERWQAADRARLDRDRLDELRPRQTQAHALQAELEELTAALEQSGEVSITRADIRALETLERTRMQALAKHEISATTIIAETAGLTRDGEALPVGTSVALFGETRIAFGEAVLRIIPPTDDAAAELARATSALDTALAPLGVETLADAYARQNAQADLRHDRDRARDQLSALAPTGLDALNAQVAALSGAVDVAELDSADGDNLAALEASEAEVFEAQGALRALQSRHADCLRKRDVARERLSLIAQDRMRLQSRLNGTDAKADDLAAAVARATQSLAAAETAYAALQAETPSLEAAQADVKRLEDADKNRAARRGQLSEDRGRLAQVVEAAQAEALGEALAEARGKRERETRRRDALALRARALTRLVEVLDAAQRELQDRFTAPVMRALGPLLHEVIPDGQIALGANFRAEGLMRNGQHEPILQLSGGTQGQIAALTRLAFADILQAQGRPVPVIFDETFVHSDDRRLEGLFRAVQMACARGVQCIVMTCHQSLFEDLGGHRIVPRQWP